MTMSNKCWNTEVQTAKLLYEEIDTIKLNMQLNLATRTSSAVKLTVL